MVEENVIVSVEVKTKNEEGLSNLEKNLSGFIKKIGSFKDFGKALQFNSKQMKEFDKSGVGANSAMTQLGAGFRKVGNSLYGLTQRFQAWALSIMFAGMFIQRTFQNIMKVGVGAFTKVMEASNIWGTNLQRLGMWWDYLKFTIGSAINTALAPLMPAIISLIKLFADWISQNPKLVAKLILAGLVFGTMAMIIGQTTLAVFGLMSMVVNFGKVLIWLAKNPLIILITYIIYLLMRYNDWKGAWADLVVVSLKFVKAMMRLQIGLVHGIVKLILWLVEKDIELWGWFVKLPLQLLAWLVPNMIKLFGWMLKSLLKLQLEFGGLIWKALLQLGQYFGVVWWAIKKVAADQWNLIVQGVEDQINNLISLLQWFVNRWDDIRAKFGKERLNIQIPQVNFDNVMWQVESFQDFWDKSSKELSENKALIDASVDIAQGSIDGIVDGIVDGAVSGASAFVNGIVDGATGFIDKITNSATTFVQKISDGWTKFVASVENTFLENIDAKIAEWEEVKKAYTNPEFQNLLDAIESMKTLAEGANEIGDSVGGLIPSVDELTKGVNELVDELKGWKVENEDVLGSKQFGGTIPKSGLYNLHAGETVTPANNFGGITVNINAPGADTKTIVRQIENELRMAIRRFN